MVGSSLLDLGAGWCGPASLIATERGASVTAVTIRSVILRLILRQGKLD
jgi:cyclopropane fatty-acyl-phospholipid synthase-like methyltransferase